MAAKIWIGLRSRVAYLRRLSVVMGVELRLRIVTELYMREMSPTQFYEEFGGGSVSRVTRNFERLEGTGWLRYIRSEGPGGKRRGGVEHFYRATELAIFDYETWSLLPYSLRIGFSWTILKQLADRWREAMEAKTFDARPDRHRSCTCLLLDQQGWEQVIAAVDALFVSLFEEQADARLRVFHSGEKPFISTIALVAFESPMRGSKRVGPSLVEVSNESMMPFPERVSKLLADEVCMRIIVETNQRAMSPTQFHREFGDGRESVDGIRRRFKLLEKIDWLKKVDEKSGGRLRGATEKFYRAAGPAILDRDPWEVPDSIKRTRSWAIFEDFSEQAKEAMRVGTFDARADRYSTWSRLCLDQRGWEQVIAAIEDLLALVLKEQERAKLRLEKSGEKPILTTVALAGFESPKSASKEP